MVKTIIKILLLLNSVPAFSQMGGFAGIQQNNVHPNNFPGIIGYWEAQSLTGANGSSVSQINDLSGNGNHWVQGSGTAQPTIVTSGLNGKRVISFDGTTDFMSLTTSVASALPKMAFHTFKKDALGDRFPTFANDDASTNPYQLFSFTDNKWYSWSRGNAFINTTAAVNDYDQYQYVTFLAKTGDADAFWKNGASQAATVNINTGSTAAYIQFGKRQTDFAKGRWFMTAFYNGELSTQNRQAVEAYFKFESGL